MSRRRVSVAWFFFHFSLVLAVSCQETFWVMGQGYTWLPPRLEKYWRKAEEFAGTLLGQNLSISNRWRQALNGYTSSAGVEGGYGFFAPGVPNSYKLVFELHYPDGRVEYELPHVGSAAAGLRLSSLLDQIGRTQYDSLREVMLKMLAYSVWREHSNAGMIRAVFGYVDVPDLAELREGRTESYNFLYAYDFSFPPEPVKAEPP